MVLSYFIEEFFLTGNRYISFQCLSAFVTLVTRVLDQIQTQNKYNSDYILYLYKYAPKLYFQPVVL